MFDPYHKWLGILPKDQPPNHYRLLGLEVFESDLDVIEGAADRQMGFVRQYQSGEYASEAAKILNELAIARLCLLKPATRAAYDAKLRTLLAPPEPEFPQISPDDLQGELIPRKRKKKFSKSVDQGLMIKGGMAVVLVFVIVFLLTSRPKRLTDVPVPPDGIAATTSVTKPGGDELKPGPTPPTTTTPSNPVAWSETTLMTEPAGEAIDLLKLVNLERDVAIGEWKQTTTALISGQQSRIYLPTKPPEDYQLKLAVRRLEGADSLMVGFTMSGRQGTMVFDGWGATVCGLYVDDRAANDNNTTRRGKVFQDQSTSRIVLTVHPGHLHASVDGKTVIDWHGNPERLQLDSLYGVGSRESTMIGVVHAKYVIESASLVPIKPERDPPRPVRLDRPVDVLPLMDVERDSQRGIWGFNKNSLYSPEGWGQIYLPTVVPLEYTLSTTVEAAPPQQGDALTIGLVAGNSYFQFTSTQADAGLDLIDGHRWNDNVTRLMGPLLKPGVPIRIDCTVTKSGIRIDVDGKTLVDWSGDVRRLSMPGDWALVDARRLYLGATRHIKFRDIKLGPPIPAPKRPDHSPISVGKPLDLLTLIDPQRDAISGTWEREGTMVRCRGDGEDNKLVIPCDVPDEYKLTIRVSRAEGGSLNNDAVCLGLPIGRAKAEVIIDGFGSTISGIHLDYMNYDRNATTQRGSPVIPAGISRELIVFVRKTGVQVTSEGKAVIDWKGNPDRFTFHTPRLTPGQRISLGSFHQGLRFERVEVEQLPPSSFPAVPSLGLDGKLLPILDVDRDSRRGNWMLKDSVLRSQGDYQATRLRIPVSPPQKYIFSATVERRTGVDDLLLGLTVGGSPCVVAIDGNIGRSAGLERLDGKDIYDAANYTQRKYGSRLLPTGKVVKVRCQVLPDTVQVTCDDQVVVRWHGDARRLSLDPRYFPPNYSEDDRTHLWLGSWASEFHIRDLTLNPMSDSDAEELSKSFSGVFPMKSQAAEPFTTVRGQASTTEASTEISVPMKQSAEPGEWVDLLEWTAGVDWAPRGANWNDHIEGGRPTREGITLKQSPNMRFPLAAIIDGDYDMELDFTRRSGEQAVSIHFPVGIHTMRLLLGSEAGAFSQVGFVDKKASVERRPAPITNNQLQRVVIRVRRDGDKASFNIDWGDIKDYLKWEGAYTALTDVDTSDWRTTMIRHPWIGGYQNNLVFHKVRVQMKTGAIRRDSITDADRKQDLQNGFVRLVGAKVLSANAYSGLFSVNQLLLKSAGEIEQRWPLITRDFKSCDDYYGAHAASHLKCPIPTGAKSFSVVGYNLASRTAKFQILLDGKLVQDSGVTPIAIMKQNIPPKASLLELVGDPVDSHMHDQIYWCFPHFHAIPAERVTDQMLDDKPGPLKFSVTSSKVGWGELTHNKPTYSQTSPPLHFRDAVPCDEFLFAHAPSAVKYSVPEGMTRFRAIGYNVLSHHVKFEVWADAKRLYESPQAGIISIDVPLPPGAKTIELKTADLGDLSADHSLWCFPRLYRK